MKGMVKRFDNLSHNRVLFFVVFFFTKTNTYKYKRKNANKRFAIHKQKQAHTHTCLKNKRGVKIAYFCTNCNSLPPLTRCNKQANKQTKVSVKVEQRY